MSSYPTGLRNTLINWNAIGNGLVVWGLFQGVSLPHQQDGINSETWSDNRSRIVLRSQGLDSSGAFFSSSKAIASFPSADVVRGACSFRNQSNDLDEIILVGRFTDIVPDFKVTKGVLKLDVATGTIRSFDQGLPWSGVGAYTVYCEQGTRSVWVSSPALSGHAARFSNDIWSTSNYFPGGGLNGMINSIAEVPGTAVTNGFKSTFLFVGNFSATAQYPLNLESALNDDRVAFSARTIDRRDALDASQLLCPTPLQTGWSVGGDPSNSSLIIEFPGITNLTGMAISGPPNSTFRMFTIPENIPVEFKDSSTGDECQACPLEGPASRQVFLFVGLAANISNMRVELNTTINSGLNSLQFFQQDTVVYADPSLNPSKCSDRETVARAEVNGSWKSVSNNDHKSLVINFNRNALPVASISFYPSSALKGSYLIYFDWPPCGIFDRCSSRTNVTLEVYKTYERKEPVSTIEVDESDPATSSTIIFSGEMGALQTDDVYVMLKISNPASRGSRALSVVASAVRFVNMSAMKKLNGVVKLNINPAGAPSWESLKDSLPSRAVVSSVAATQDGRIFLGGSFRYKRSSNIILYTDEKFWPLSEGGLDGAVSSIVFFENVLYIAGSFRGTLEQRFPTNNFARYFFDTGVWKPLDFGPNLYQSAQLSIDPLSRTIYVTSADNLTSLVGWNITSETYFRLASTSGSVDRMLFDTSSLSSPSLLMSVGRMTTFEPIVSRNAAVLSTNEPPAIDFSGLDVNSVASAFVDSAKPNLVYFNGKFVFNGTAPSSESLVAYDLKNRRWQYPGLSFDGEVTCLEKAGSQYFIGGQFDRVSVNNNNNSFVKSMALWNPDSNSLTVPIAPLESATGSPRVRKAIFLPKRQEVAAFGDFTGPLGLSCTNVCLWSLESSSWKAVDFGRMTYLNVTAVEAFQNNLVLGGTFIVNNQPHFLVAWDVDSGQLNPIPVKGSVQYLAADALGKYVYVGGFSSERLVPYLSTWDGNVISDVALDPRSDIRGIQSVPLNDSDALPTVVLFGSIWFNFTQYSSVVVVDNTVSAPFILASNEGGSGLFFGMVPFFKPVYNPPGQGAFRNVTIPVIIGVVALLGLLFICGVAVLVNVAFTRRRRRELREEEKVTLERGAGSTIASRDSNESVYETLVDTYTLGEGTQGEESRATSSGERTLSRPVEVDASNMMEASVAGGLKEEEKPAVVSRDEMYMDRLRLMDTPRLPDIMPLWGTALYTFSSNEPGELQFGEGARILVIDNADPLWWMGMVDNGDGSVGIIGVFPSTYIQLQDEGSLSPSSTEAVLS